MFIDNKYTATYLRLIANRVAHPCGCDVYVEKHHIIPRCLGGSDKPENIVKLSGREHYVAHLLLTKMVEGSNRRKMIYALLCFNRHNPNHAGRYAAKSKLYEYVKNLISSTPIDISVCQKISFALRGRKRSKEVCDAIGNAHRGKNVSSETKLKMRNAKLGKILPQDTRRKMSEAHKGKSFTDQHKANLKSSYQKTETRSAAIAQANKKKRKPCTVDGFEIFESKSALEAKLGKGKLGSRSPAFRFITGE